MTWKHKNYMDQTLDEQQSYHKNDTQSNTC